MLWRIRVSCSVVSHSSTSMDCSPPGSSCSWNSLSKNTEAGCHSLLQGIFPTQGSNAGLLHCRWIFYHLSLQGSPLEDTYLAATLASTNWMLKYPPAGASQVAQLLKNLPCNVRDKRDTGSKPGSGRSPGGGDGNLLQYSCLGNPMDGGAGGLWSVRSQRVGHD